MIDPEFWLLGCTVMSLFDCLRICGGRSFQVEQRPSRKGRFLRQSGFDSARLIGIWLLRNFFQTATTSTQTIRSRSLLSHRNRMSISFRAYKPTLNRSFSRTTRIGVGIENGRSIIVVGEMVWISCTNRRELGTSRSRASSCGA